MIRIKFISSGFIVIFLLVLNMAGIIQKVQAAVTMVSFKAFSGDQKVILEWETASETDMLGFYVTRNNQFDGNYDRVSNLIFTQGTSVSGQVYHYIDTNLINEKTYYYKLETLDDNYEIEFSDADIQKITSTYHQWQVPAGDAYQDMPEFCYSASFDEVAKKVLTDMAGILKDDIFHSKRKKKISKPPLNAPKIIPIARVPVSMRQK